MRIEKAEEILHTLSPMAMVALWNDYCNFSGRGNEVIYRNNSESINQIFKDKTPYEIVRDLKNTDRYDLNNDWFDLNNYWFWMICGKLQSFNNPFYFIRTDTNFLQYLIDSGKLKENQA